jgi:hypothetical protein
LPASSTALGQRAVAGHRRGEHDRVERVVAEQVVQVGGEARAGEARRPALAGRLGGVAAPRAARSRRCPRSCGRGWGPSSRGPRRRSSRSCDRHPGRAAPAAPGTTRSPARPSPYSGGPLRRALALRARRARRPRRGPRARSSPPRTVSVHSVRSRSVTHGHPGEVGLLLHAARVGEHRAGVQQQRREVQVAERRHEPHAGRASSSAQQAGGLEPGARARVQREHDRGRASRPGRATSRSRRSGSSTVPAGGGWRAGTRPARRRTPPAPRCRSRARGASSCATVDHHVATRPHRQTPSRAGARPASRRSTAAGRTRGRPGPRLSSSGIARSNERMPASTCATGIRASARRQRARQRRVRVAVDEHDVRRLGGQQRRQREPAMRPRLLRVGAAAEVEPVLGAGSSSSVEEAPGELGVVVLARCGRAPRRPPRAAGTRPRRP